MSLSSLALLILTLSTLSQGGIFSTKKKTWIQSVAVNSLPPLPKPVVSVQRAEHKITILQPLQVFLRKYLPHKKDVEELSKILLKADTAGKFEWRFWVDSKLSLGVLELLVIRKQQQDLSIIVGSATLNIPNVYNTLQVCKSKKGLSTLWKTKTRCHDEYQARGLTGDEIAFIGRTLEEAIRSHTELQQLVD